MASVCERAASAVVGAFVADAAAAAFHWVYDTTKIKSLVGSGNPEFFTPHTGPYYNINAGDFSIYAQQTGIYAQSIITSGKVDPSAIAQAYYAFYKPDGAAGQPRANTYLDGSTKKFIANVEAGKSFPESGGEDNQANAIAHMVPVVALLAGSPNLLATVDAATRVTQNTNEAAAFACAAARLLEKAILTGSAGKAEVQSVASELRNPNRVHPFAEDAALADGLDRALAAAADPNFDFVQKVGSHCGYPNNLLTGAHLIASGASYTDAVRQTILAGGDNCSRGIFVGAVTAAVGGASAIPAEWKSKTNQIADVEAWAQQLAAKTFTASSRAAGDL